MEMLMHSTPLFAAAGYPLVYLLGGGAFRGRVICVIAKMSAGRVTEGSWTCRGKATFKRCGWR